MLCVLGIEPKKLMESAGIAEGQRVADLGCGSHGVFVFEAARLVGKSGRVYAVDVQKSVLQAVASKRKVWPVNGQIEIVWSNLEHVGATAIPGASLDAAFLINVLNQSQHHALIIKEAGRLLKNGGVLLIIDWESLKAPFAPHGCCEAHPEDIKKLAASADLAFVETFPTSQYHFGLKFVKGSKV